MSEKPSDLPRTFGNYSLLKLLARGGMGEIFLARTVGITGFEKYYAVKKLLRKFTHDADVGGRFIDEAKLGARLQHPNIVQVYDLGKVNDELYMATEFVDGFDLRRVLRFCHEKKKRIPLDIALFIVREVLSGLAYAHRQVDAEGALINLIHRDISPQNVLVSFEGEVKIIDFGLAKSTQRSQETQANVLLGNFGYMSPEQARGQILDVRTDIYSAGIVLFELVTGTKRFVEENPLKLLEMVARPTPIMPSDRVPSVPKAIDRIFERATSQDRENRFATAESFRDDVTAALHRLNPRASRENLAQFLNHLFLGGQAPPGVDADVLNKSVVLMAKDLHGDTDALSSTALEDLKNRSLSSDFSDTGQQTSSLPLLRSARVGDVLSHDAITGEAAPAPRVSQPLVVDDDDDDGVRLVDGFDQVGMTAQMLRDQTSERPASSQDGAVLSAEHDDENQRPTRVYDALSWPQQEGLDVELAPSAESAETTEIRFGGGPSSSELDIQRQLDEQVDAQVDIQRQLEAQMMRQAQLEQQMQAQLQAQMQAQMQAQLEQARLEQQREQQRLAEQQREQQRLAEQQRQAEQARLVEQQRQADIQRQAMLEEQARQQMFMRQLEQQRQQQAAMEAAAPPPSPPSAPRGPVPSRRIQPLGAATTTETMMPAVDIPIPTRRATPVQETPSIMLSPELEAEMGAVPMDDATRRNPRSSFGEGGAHESLIIDFGSGDGSSDNEELPVVEGQQAPIRPAARPMGRPVVPAVSAARPRRASDEGPPTSMPPPTRRR